MDKKITTQQEITAIAGKLKQEGKKIVTYNGSFDIVHIGHVQAIAEAKKQGDVLILLVNSDASVKLYKGPNRPINPQQARTGLLAGFGDVDYVVLFDQINPKELLEAIKPDVHCNGQDWGKDCLEREVVEKHGGQIHILAWADGFSTSNMIAKILQAYSQPEIKAIFVDTASFTMSVEDSDRLSKTGYKIIAEKVSGMEMFMDAVKQFGITLSKSWLVSGTQEAIVVGRNVNIKTIKIGDRIDAGLKLEPNAYAKNMEEAIEIIAKN